MIFKISSGVLLISSFLVSYHSYPANENGLKWIENFNLFE